MAQLKNIAVYIKNHRLSSVLLTLFIFQYSNFYRIAMRCLYEGSEFEWMDTWGVSLLGEERAMRLMGNGLEGHFLIILLFAILFVAVIFGMIRRQGDRFTGAIVLGFSAVLAIREVMLAIAYGDQYKIVGETFKLQLDYSLIGPFLSLLIFLLAVIWVFHHTKKNEIEGAVINVYLSILLLIIPAVLFLRLGEQHDWTDSVGISLIYVQLMLLILNWMGVFHGQKEMPKSPVSH